MRLSKPAWVSPEPSGARSADRNVLIARWADYLKNVPVLVVTLSVVVAAGLARPGGAEGATKTATPSATTTATATVDPGFLARAYADLSSGEAETRRAAVTRLSALRLPEIPGVLEATLRDPSADVRSAALAGLDALLPPDALDLFRAALGDDAASVRYAALEIAAHRARRRATPGQTADPTQRALLDRLRASFRDDSDPAVRGRALRALAALDLATLADVRAAAASPDQTLAMEAIRLAGSHAPLFDATVVARGGRARDPEVRRAAAAAANDARFGPRTEAERRELRRRLRDALADPEADVRIAAAEALSVSLTADELPAVARALADPHPRVRSAAAEAVALLRPRDGPAWIAARATIESDPSARLAARYAEIVLRPTRTCTVTGTITVTGTRTATSTPTLAPDRAKTATQEALDRYRSRTPCATATGSATRVPRRRGSATGTMSATPSASPTATGSTTATATATEDMRAHEEILAALASPYRRVQAREYLRRMGRDAAPALGIALQHPTPQIRAEAISLLAELRLSGFDPMLDRLTRDPEVSVRAAAERAKLVLRGPPPSVTAAGARPAPAKGKKDEGVEKLQFRRGGPGMSAPAPSGSPTKSSKPASIDAAD